LAHSKIQFSDPRSESPTKQDPDYMQAAMGKSKK
jgi:hypothetical protein